MVLPIIVGKSVSTVTFAIFFGFEPIFIPTASTVDEFLALTRFRIEIILRNIS